MRPAKARAGEQAAAAEAVVVATAAPDLPAVGELVWFHDRRRGHKEGLARVAAVKPGGLLDLRVSNGFDEKFDNVPQAGSGDPATCWVRARSN